MTEARPSHRDAELPGTGGGDNGPGRRSCPRSRRSPGWRRVEAARRLLRRAAPATDPLRLLIAGMFALLWWIAGWPFNMILSGSHVRRPTTRGPATSTSCATSPPRR